MTIAEHEQRWRGWFDTINQDITTVYLWRATWLAVGDIVRTNPQIRPSHVFAYLSINGRNARAFTFRGLLWCTHCQRR